METSISRGAIERITSEHLQLKKMTTCWVPSIFIDAQRIERVRLCQENLAKYHQ